GAGSEPISTPTGYTATSPKTAPTEIEATEIADLLLHLFDRSLVAFDEATGRYRLLESVREYATEKLSEFGNEEREAWRLRHRQYFLANAELAFDKKFTYEAPSLLAQLERDHDNLRAALDFSKESTDAELHLRLAGALQKYWELLGHLVEGRE